MGKRIKKTDNYFERVKQHANRTNYRYYFFDYLYFKGEQGHKMRSRCSGALRGTHAILILVVYNSNPVHSAI